MRKLLFYLFILKKVFLLLIYPIFEHKGKVFLIIRKNIENFLIFQPSRLRAKKIQRGLLKKINPQWFINPEGIRLYSWFVKPQGNMPVILHFHGQAESILSHQDLAIFCMERGLGLFMLSYRGHYKSGGNASEQGIYNDAKAAILQLKKLGVDEDKIILWGHSLGTVVAVETAVHHSVLGVILQSPIKEIKSAAADVYEFYCTRLNLHLLASFVKHHIGKINFIQKLDSINKVEHVKCPILIMHSKTDKITPWKNSVDLSERNPNSKLYVSDTGSHWDADWCLNSVLDFIQITNYCGEVNSK